MRSLGDQTTIQLTGWSGDQIHFSRFFFSPSLCVVPSLTEDRESPQYFFPTK